MPRIVALVSAHTITLAGSCRYSQQPKHKPELLFWRVCLNCLINFYMWRTKFTNERCKKVTITICLTMEATILDTHSITIFPFQCQSYTFSFIFSLSLSISPTYLLSHTHVRVSPTFLVVSRLLWKWYKLPSKKLIAEPSANTLKPFNVSVINRTSKTWVSFQKKLALTFPFWKVCVDTPVYFSQSENFHIFQFAFFHYKLDRRFVAMPLLNCDVLLVVQYFLIK